MLNFPNISSYSGLNCDFEEFLNKAVVNFVTSLLIGTAHSIMFIKTKKILEQNQLETRKTDFAWIKILKGNIFSIPTFSFERSTHIILIHIRAFPYHLHHSTTTTAVAAASDVAFFPQVFPSAKFTVLPITKEGELLMMMFTFYRYIFIIIFRAFCSADASVQKTYAFSMISWDHFRLQTFRSNTRAHVHVCSRPTLAEAKPPTNVHSSNGGGLPLLLLRTVFFFFRNPFYGKVTVFCETSRFLCLTKSTRDPAAAFWARESFLNFLHVCCCCHTHLHRRNQVL